MSVCEHCGAIRTERAERYGLLAQSEPPAVYWKGRRLPFTRAELRILIPLVIRGYVSIGYIEMVFPNVSNAYKQAQVLIARIRRKLFAESLPHKVINEPGEGYRLLPDDAPVRPPKPRVVPVNGLGTGVFATGYVGLSAEDLHPLSATGIAWRGAQPRR